MWEGEESLTELRYVQHSSEEDRNGWMCSDNKARIPARTEIKGGCEGGVQELISVPVYVYYIVVSEGETHIRTVEKLKFTLKDYKIVTKIESRSAQSQKQTSRHWCRVVLKVTAVG